ncbi:hypothetical protein HDU96_007723 [Phlyctochytrium bullatum]|nr:hypothetical protein HDU96_007723 [Phlyctochytrium bullatum]
MYLVLYRRMKDIYLILQLQEENDTKNTTIKALKGQVEVMLKPHMQAEEDKKQSKTNAAEKSKDLAEEPVVLEKEAPKDITESAGLRKRK